MNNNLSNWIQNLPLSTDVATQAELNNELFNLSTALVGTNEDTASSDTINGSKKYAKEYTNDAINTVISGAPEAFDTLKEIADWILSDQTSSAKLISDVANLQEDVSFVSNDLSIDIGRITVTEDNGYQPGEERGFLASYDFESTTSYTNDGGSAYAFPVSRLVDNGAWTLDEIKDACAPYGSYSDPYFETNAQHVIGYGNQENGTGTIGIETNTITGYYDDIGTVYAHYGSQYDENMIEWQDSNGNPQDGTSCIELPTKVIEINGQYVYRTPYYYYYYYYDSPSASTSRVSFILIKDRIATREIKIFPFEDKVSSTYATKTEVQNEFTAISEDIQILESKALTAETDPIFKNWLSGNSYNKIIGKNNTVASNAISTIVIGNDNFISGATNVAQNTLIGNANTINQQHTRANLLIGNGTTLDVYEAVDPLNRSTFDNTIIQSSGTLYGSQNTLMHCKFNKLSGNWNIIIDGASWNVRSTFDDLSASDIVYIGRKSVKEEHEVDSIESGCFYVHEKKMADSDGNVPYARLSSVLSGYVPLSDYQALESRVTSLESRLSDIETIVDQINGIN